MSLYVGSAVDMFDVTVDGTATSIGALANNLITGANISVSGGDIRISISGIAPTTAFGHLVSDGANITIVGGSNTTRFMAIAEDGVGPVTLTVTTLAGAGL